jgi:hypothetical protein
LGDPDSKIRTAVGMAIAAIASWDWPQSWPGLMEHLIASIKTRSNPVLGKAELGPGLALLVVIYGSIEGAL